MRKKRRGLWEILLQNCLSESHSLFPGSDKKFLAPITSPLFLERSPQKIKKKKTILSKTQLMNKMLIEIQKIIVTINLFYPFPIIEPKSFVDFNLIITFEQSNVSFLSFFLPLFYSKISVLYILQLFCHITIINNYRNHIRLKFV